MKKTYKYCLQTLAFLAILSACKNDENASPQEQKILVSIVSPKQQSTSFPINSSGSLSTKKEMKLSFKTGGIIQSINADEGSRVKKGQQLAKLNTSEIEAQVSQAKLGVEKAHRDLERAKNLHADSVATLEQLQNAKTAVAIAESQLQIAEFNLTYSSIHAPYNGKILKRLAESNEMIAPGHPVFFFGSDESDWILRTNLVDVDVVRVKLNDKAKLEFDAFPNKKFNAFVSEIASIADPYTGTYEVELSVSESDSKFVSGLIGSVSIFPSELQTYLTLPVSSIHDAHEALGTVFVAHGENYEKRLVKIMHVSDSLIYLNGELSLSDSIIYDGASYLIPGSKIRISD